MRVRLAWLALALAVALPVAAQDTPGGDSSEQARAFFEVGAQAYERGDYAAAIDAFREAYAREKRPGLLFSMAQAHRRAFFATNDATHLARAVENYRAYLGSGDAARRRDAEEALVQLVPLVGSTPEATPAEEPAPRTDQAKLMIASSTPGAVLELDGVRAPRLPHVATVAPGNHTLVVSAPGFVSETRSLPVPEGAAFALDIPLRELPGQLSVRGESGAALWLDGRLIGMLPLPPLPISAGSHQLSLQKSGHRVETRRVRVERGERRDLALPLVSTLQRRTSLSLFAAGGSGVLTGAVLAVVARLRQNDAAHLLDVRDARPLSERELRRYEQLVQQRDRLRASAVGVGAAGAGCLLLGAALFALDRPEVPGLFGGDPDPSESTPQAPPAEVIAGPVWDGQQVGVAVHGRF